MKVTLSRHLYNANRVDYLKRNWDTLKYDPILELEDHPEFPGSYGILVGGKRFATIQKESWRDYFDPLPLVTKSLPDYG